MRHTRHFGGETVKAAPFEYVRPGTVAAALSALAAHEDARIIAGGQTLVPIMAMRLARPSHLIDIAHIPQLKNIEERDGAVRIGAAVRQLDAERSALVSQKLPLLAAAFPWIGHHATRARGTIGGSLANADPAAEIAMVAVALDATIFWQNAEGEFATPAREFFTGPMMTILDGVSILTAAGFPHWQGGRIGAALHEVSQRRSDFAYVSACAQVQLSANGVCERACLAIGGATPSPV
ncbi:MAG: xanthine dehydrogenase family protein subunit M, partial [Alphaproteobacteria bacterium]|nr:xanthine dehydrogenase family protein subunit M [Alphaproteobacteria bacterium]